MTVRRVRPLRGPVAALTAAVGLVATVVASVGAIETATAASTTRPIIFGAAAGSKAEVLDHERVLGRRLQGIREYKLWSSTLFGPDQIWARDTGHTLFLSIKAKRNGSALRFRDIANAQPGSQLYSEMLGQARQIKDFRAQVFITFNHEPEASASDSMGSGADFIAAWRKVVSTYRAAGVTNARYVLNLTSWAFTRTDASGAANYYPGDAYVDHIAADGYNWYACRAGTKWRSLAEVVEGQRRFGQQHPDKGLMLYEFSSTEDGNQSGRKAQWFREATQLFKQPGYEQFKAVLQWNGRNYSTNCGFDYRTSASATDAWRDMGNDPAYTADAAADIWGTTTAPQGGTQSATTSAAAAGASSRQAVRSTKMSTGSTTKAVGSSKKAAGAKAGDRTSRRPADAAGVAGRAVLAAGDVSPVASSSESPPPSDRSSPIRPLLLACLALVLIGAGVLLRRRKAPTGTHREV